jgi:hypothetical protein
MAWSAPRSSVSDTIKLLATSLKSRFLDYLPALLQAAKALSTIRAGVLCIVPYVVIPIGSMFSGITIKVMRKYRFINLFSWILLVCGFASMISITARTSSGGIIGLSVLPAFGVGVRTNPCPARHLLTSETRRSHTSARLSRF